MPIVEADSVKSEVSVKEVSVKTPEKRRTVLKKMLRNAGIMLVTGIAGISGLAASQNVIERMGNERIGIARPKILGEIVLKKYKEKHLSPEGLFQKPAEIQHITEIQASDIDKFPDNPPLEIREYLEGTEKARVTIQEGLFKKYLNGHINIDARLPSDLPLTSYAIKELIKSKTQIIIDALNTVNLPGANIWEISGDPSENTIVDNGDVVEKIIDSLEKAGKLEGTGISQIAAFVSIDKEKGIMYNSYPQIDTRARRIAFNDLEKAIIVASSDIIGQTDYSSQRLDWIKKNWGTAQTSIDQVKLASAIRTLILSGEIETSMFDREVENISEFSAQILSSPKTLEQINGSKDSSSKDLDISKASLGITALTDIIRRKLSQYIPQLNTSTLSETTNTSSSQTDVQVNLLRVNPRREIISRRTFLKVGAAFTIGAILGAIKIDNGPVTKTYEETINVIKELFPQVDKRVERWIGLMLKEDVFDQISGSTRILSADKKLLYKYSPNINREFVSFTELKEQNPELFDYLCKLITVEDKNFWNHDGVDPDTIVSAQVNNFINKTKRGGSTITQQAVKNVCYYLQPEYLQTEIDANRVKIRISDNERKIEEQLTATALEQAYIEKYGNKRLAKEKIMEIYFNAISFGPNCIGMQTAARDIFGKDLVSLSKAEVTFIFNFIQDPIGRYPFIDSDNKPIEYQNIDNVQKTLAGVRATIRSLTSRGIISESEAAELTLSITPTKPSILRNPSEITLKALNSFINNAENNLLIQGADIITTIDSKMQTELEQAISATKGAMYERFDANTVVVVIKNIKGEIVASYGDIFNLDRSVGSTSKPIAYAEALRANVIKDETTTVYDTEYSVSLKNGNTYQPTSYGGTYHGEATARKALFESYNIVPIKFMESVGLKYGEMLVKLGVIRPKQLDFTELPTTMPLGIFTSTVDRLSNIMMLFLNKGETPQTKFISEVITKSKENIYKPKEIRPRRLIPSSVAQKIKTMLTSEDTQFKGMHKTGTSTAFDDPDYPGNVWITETSADGKYTYVLMATNSVPNSKSVFGNHLGSGATGTSVLSSLNYRIRGITNSANNSSISSLQ